MPLAMLDNEELVDRLTRAILERTGRTVRGLRVEVKDGLVTLWGVSPSYYYKQLASHAAMEELGNQPLANEIQVR